MTSVRRLVEGNIFRNVHHYRARTTAPRDVERLLHDHGQVADILDQEIVFHDRPGNTHRVAFLECILPNGCCRDLACDHHQRNAVHVRRGNASHRIGHARARRDQCNANITSGSGVPISSMNRSLLMAHQHVKHSILLVQRVINVQDGATWVTPDVLNAFSLQRLDEDFRTAEFLWVASSRCCGSRSDFGFRDFHDQPFENFSDEKPWVLLCELLWSRAGT